MNLLSMTPYCGRKSRPTSSGVGIRFLPQVRSRRQGEDGDAKRSKGNRNLQIDDITAVSCTECVRERPCRRLVRTFQTTRNIARRLLCWDLCRPRLSFGRRSNFDIAFDTAYKPRQQPDHIAFLRNCTNSLRSANVLGLPLWLPLFGEPQPDRLIPCASPRKRRIPAIHC